MRFHVLALLFLVTGCSEFPLPDWARSDDTSSSNYVSTNGGTNVAAPADDLGSCQEQANAVIKRDEAIDQDIANQNTNSNLQQGLGDLNNNLSLYNRKNRYNRIVDDCMAARGYDSQNPNVKPVQVEQNGSAAPAPSTAPETAPELTPAPSSGINPNLPTYP
ncbi:hypothetical protein [Hypericibacter sp.]|uniref:hypothetical protein n=1 Tax=Hypericibacter sp. TaxID=2705401 RepID=UPI003D6D15D0